jgi:hypothetical protein
MKVHMYEVDNGPGGITWACSINEYDCEGSTYLTDYSNEGEMMNAASIFRKLGHDVRFHTQAEYELHMQLEIMLENDIYG